MKTKKIVFKSPHFQIILAKIALFLLSPQSPHTNLPFISIPCLSTATIILLLFDLRNLFFFLKKKNDDS